MPILLFSCYFYNYNKNRIKVKQLRSTILFLYYTDSNRHYNFISLYDTLYIFQIFIFFYLTMIQFILSFFKLNNIMIIIKFIIFL